jgi:integrase
MVLVNPHLIGVVAMDSKIKSDKSSKPDKLFKGSVGVESYQGRLRLRLPRQLFEGRQKYLMPGLADTAIHRKLAEAKAKLIESDIAMERFDYTLAKYGHQQSPARSIVAAVKPKPASDLAKLWAQYTEAQAKRVSETTLKLNYVRVAGHIRKLPTRSLDDAIVIRDHLLAHNSAYTAHRIWVQLNACCKWALRSKLIAENPFADLGDDFKLGGTEPEQFKDIDSFSKAEMETVMAAFENHPRHKHYAPFVKFLFWTGARTSEAVGLKWKHISPDFKIITFSEAVVNVSSKSIRKCTKTKKPRKFPLFSLPKLVALLQSLKPENCDPESPVFSSATGKLINAHSFNAHVWKGCKNHGKQIEGIVTQLAKAGEIDHYRPQYQTRHTFITLQVAAGKSSTTVARWVGNHANVIEKHYMGDLSHVGAAEV